MSLGAKKKIDLDESSQVRQQRLKGSRLFVNITYFVELCSDQLQYVIEGLISGFLIHGIYFGHTMLDKMNEDEFTDYLIQLSIEESCHEVFAIWKNRYVLYIHISFKLTLWYD